MEHRTGQTAGPPARRGCGSLRGVSSGGTGPDWAKQKGSLRDSRDRCHAETSRLEVWKVGISRVDWQGVATNTLCHNLRRIANIA
jgi:hypothetical protein